MFNIFNRTRLTPFPQNQTQNIKTNSNGKPLPRRRSIIREFALNTSTHALPGIARSESKHNRIFWSISFVIFTGVMSYFVTKSIINYFQYPTQTSVSVVVERSQSFPAVTICNYSPARADLGIGPFVNYTNSRNLTNTTVTSPFTLQQASYLAEFLIDQVNTGMAIESLFFSLDIMLVSCLYNGKSCNTSDFISFISPTYGSCYTFNAKTKSGGDDGIRKTNENGGYGRLELRLYAHNHLYIPYITEDVAVGMVAMIHDNTELPLIDIAGMYLSSGNRYKLAYKRKSAYFLSSPYTDCTSEIPVAMSAMYSRYEGADYAYSQGVCHILCVQAYTYHECGCVSPNQWSARSVVLPGSDTVINALLCNTSNTCYINASNRISESDTIWNEYCSDCKRACSTSDFSVTVSSARTLPIFYAYLIKNFVELTGVPLPTNWSENWLTEVNNNYISLDVVCSSTTIENLTQEASVGAVDVLSNVGGHTGLWIGISFLSIMEFVEMLYRLARLELQIIRRRINGRR